MTANELRVGNFVKVNGIIRECSYVSLKVITTKEDYPICFGIKEIEPIPLTKKWFEKFGFKMRIAPDGFIRRFPDELSSYENQYTKEGIIISEYHFQGQEIRYEFIYPNSDPSIYSTLKLDYVHQLQNLFFDLKGYELKVKED